MIRAAALCLACAIASPAWVESVEFPWHDVPQPVWERQLAWLKNAGFTHVSLPAAQDADGLNEVIRLIRRLDMEADLEGPVPDALLAQTRAHGGPLTDPLPGNALRISSLASDALVRARAALEGGKPAVLWTDVTDMLAASGFKPGALTFTGENRSAAAVLRRDALLAAYWNKSIGSIETIPGGGVSKPENAPGSPAPAVQQFGSETGFSFLSVTNSTGKPWNGELRAMYAPARRQIGIPNVTVRPNDTLWLPVNVPLKAGPLCKDCTAFANGDHLIYATAELTAMEYENGILAMEFTAADPGEVMLQLSSEPSGPLVAGGKPSIFEWDDRAMRARLHIPAGTGADKRVRIGLAIEPPDATAFFDNGRVLMIGETNPLTAQFSSEAILQRSRLRISPDFANAQDAGKDATTLTYKITVPDFAVAGDHADLAIEADGMRMSHVRPALLRPVELKFANSIEVKLATGALLPLYPATIPVNQRNGRELIVTLKNNAPEIRTFVLQPQVEGLEFSPAKLEVTVGVSTSREVSFRVFTKDAAPGLHTGIVQVSGAAKSSEPVQFAIIPDHGSVAYATSGFSFMETTKARATFMPGKWLEYVTKDNGQELLPAGGVPFAHAEPLRFEDLEPMLPRRGQ